MHSGRLKRCLDEIRPSWQALNGGPPTSAGFNYGSIEPLGKTITQKSYNFKTTVRQGTNKIIGHGPNINANRPISVLVIATEKEAILQSMDTFYVCCVLFILSPFHTLPSGILITQCKSFDGDYRSNVRAAQCNVHQTGSFKHWIGVTTCWTSGTSWRSRNDLPFPVVTTESALFSDVLVVSYSTCQLIVSTTQ